MFISVFGIILVLIYPVTERVLDTRTAREAGCKVGRKPDQSFGFFSRSSIYPEMSRISINELCLEPVKNLDSGV